MFIQREIGKCGPQIVPLWFDYWIQFFFRKIFKKDTTTCKIEFSATFVLWPNVVATLIVCQKRV